MFDEQAVTTIGHTKTVLNLPDIACRLKGPDGGHIKIAVTQGPVFMNAVRAVPVRSLNVVSDDNLKKQYREFLKRLEKSTRQYSIEQLCEIDPKDILKLFFQPESGLFVDIEMVMQAISVCCVKISCESVLESLVSVFENHFDPKRNMKEESTTEEFMIAVNAPSLGHADAVIREAVNSYWKSKAQKRGGNTSSTSWHFFRTTVVEQLKENSGSSKVLNRMLTGHRKLPFMDT